MELSRGTAIFQAARFAADKQSVNHVTGIHRNKVVARGGPIRDANQEREAT